MNKTIDILNRLGADIVNINDLYSVLNPNKPHSLEDLYLTPEALELVESLRSTLLTLRALELGWSKSGKGQRR